MKTLILSLLPLLAAALAVQAETKVTLSGVHLCCKGCVKGVTKAVDKSGSKATCDAKAGTVAISGTKESVGKALEAAALCSNDPICAQHHCGESMEGRWLHGAACHGCGFIAETSCEMRNEYLDRALVVPTLAIDGAAFFGSVS